MSQVHNTQPPPPPPPIQHTYHPHTLCCPYHITCTQQAFFPAPSAHKPVILLSTSHHRHTTGSLPLSAQHTNQLFCCPRHITGIQQVASHSLLSTQTSYSVVHVTSQAYNRQPPTLCSAHKPVILLSTSHHRHTTGSLPLSAQHTNQLFCCPRHITGIQQVASHSLLSTQTSYSVVHVTSQAYNRQPPTLCSAHKPVILLSTSHHRHTTGSLPLSAQHTNQLFCCPRHITGIQQAASHSLLSTQTSYSVVHVTSQAYNRQPPTLCSAHKPSIHTLLFISHHKPAQFII